MKHKLSYNPFYYPETFFDIEQRLFIRKVNWAIFKDDLSVVIQTIYPIFDQLSIMEDWECRPTEKEALTNLFHDSLFYEKLRLKLINDTRYTVNLQTTP